MVARRRCARYGSDRHRETILDAASQCVRQAGFHGSNMAKIAETAGLSVGQIYRYFENKEAIIEAIVERNSADICHRFDELGRQRGKLADNLARQCGAALARFDDPGRAALMLEIIAEAARNPKVGKIVQSADARERAMGLRLLETAQPAPCQAKQLAAREEALGMLFDGMAVRVVCNPTADREEVTKILQWLVRMIVDGPTPTM